MRKFNLFMTFFIMVMVVTGCSTSNPPAEVQVTFLDDGQTISTNDFHTYTVQIKNKDGLALDVESVYMFMNMKMMNHPIEGTMNKVDTGLYEIDLPLAMSGDWYVDVSVTYKGETIVYEDFSITAEGPKQMEWMKGFNKDHK
ncbi:hypothetical protein DS745_18605 [Anaerobacillus alkaliphilus]|uniref:YtkA-like domain-containing protein n=1 Tax=Anaerobacillus alkaliphilus TaxID=1548597 RepID=A0A4Q0VPF1_9BACI|nr:hypothetical protein [Anaerobacillus alkaliphilus]RXI98336.1 hypothetical protein DS745_18605 [Anaerobacillus alkaliphilus]